MGIDRSRAYVQDTPRADASFLDYYAGGWQELFPNAGASCTYKGAELGVHGELCKIPWEYCIEEGHSGRVSVRAWVRTVRTPFLVEKTLTVEAGRPVLFIEEAVKNEGGETMDFMWGHHPAFGAPFLCEHCRLFVPAAGVETLDLPDSRQILPPDQHFASFPMVKTKDGLDFDLSRILPPSARVSHTSFLKGLQDGWFALVNEQSGLGFAMNWDVKVFPYIWLWEELCGTPGYPWWWRSYVVGVEPQSSLSRGGLKGAIQEGTQLSLKPGETVRTQLCATSFVASGKPCGVSDEGEVRYEPRAG